MEQLELFASYKRLDGIGGTIKGYRQSIKTGNALPQIKESLNLEQVQENKVFHVRF